MGITVKTAANGHVIVGLITEFNSKICIRRPIIIAASTKAILVNIRKLLLLGNVFHCKYNTTYV